MSNFLGWLNDERSRRNILIEADAYRPRVGVMTHYWSTGKFVSRATDDPPHTPYPALVSKVPAVSLSLDDPLGWGEIELRNPGGVLDGLLQDSFGWREVRVYLGDPAWAKADYYRFVLRAGRDGLKVSGVDKLVLTLENGLAALEQPMQTAIIEGTDKLVPLAFGQNFNVEPVFVKEDIEGAHYQVNEGAIAALTVRTGGLDISPTRLFPDLPNGKFRIDPPPNGRPTCNVDRSAASVVEVARQILTRAGVAYDAGNFGYWDAVCPHAAGLYVGDKTTYREALDTVLNSVGLYFHGWPDGVVRLYRVAQPAGDPVLVLVPANIAEHGLKPTGVIHPLALVRLGYLRNNTVQDKDSLYGAVDTAAAELYSAPWSTVTAENVGLAALYPAAAVLPDAVTATQLLFKPDAETEAARRLAMYDAPIYEFELELFYDPLCAPGDVVQITYPRFGFENGKLALVVGFEWKPEQRKTTLKVRAWL